MPEDNIEIQLFEVDSQTTAAVMTCTACGMRSKPIYDKRDIEMAREQHVCKGKINA